MVEVSYDQTHDIAYIAFNNGTDYSRSIHLDKYKEVSSFILDLNKEGRLMGIEVLDASKCLPKEILDHALRIEKMRNEPKELGPGC